MNKEEHREEAARLLVLSQQELTRAGETSWRSVPFNVRELYATQAHIHAVLALSADE